MNETQTWVIASRLFNEKFARQAGNLNSRQLVEWRSLVQMYGGSTLLLAIGLWIEEQGPRLRNRSDIGLWGFLRDYTRDSCLERAASVMHRDERIVGGTDYCPSAADEGPCTCGAIHTPWIPYDPQLGRALTPEEEAERREQFKPKKLVHKPKRPKAQFGTLMVGEMLKENVNE